MQEVEITWGRAIKVWWSLIWRGILYSAIAGFILAFINDVAELNMPPEVLSLVGSLMVGIPIGW